MLPPSMLTFSAFLGLSGLSSIAFEIVFQSGVSSIDARITSEQLKKERKRKDLQSCGNSIKIQNDGKL